MAKLNIEMTLNDEALFERAKKMKFFCNNVEYKEVTEIDTERGYLDYYAKHDDEFVVVGDSALIHRIFGVCRIEE